MFDGLSDIQVLYHSVRHMQAPHTAHTAQNFRDTTHMPWSGTPGAQRSAVCMVLVQMNWSMIWNMDLRTALLTSELLTQAHTQGT